MENSRGKKKNDTKKIYTIYLAFRLRTYTVVRTEISSEVFFFFYYFSNT